MTREVIIVGRVFSGLGEGSKYIEIYRDQLRRNLGIDPYPGTLNIDAGFRVDDILAFFKPIVIPPPSNMFGIVHAYNALFYDEKVYILKPIRSKYGSNVLEIVSKNGLRQKYGLRDGDLVEVILME